MRKGCPPSPTTTSHVVSGVSAVCSVSVMAAVSTSRWRWARAVSVVSLALRLMLVDGTYGFEE
jgi:hypothetical protein